MIFKIKIRYGFFSPFWTNPWSITRAFFFLPLGNDEPGAEIAERSTSDWNKVDLAERSPSLSPLTPRRAACCREVRAVSGLLMAKWIDSEARHKAQTTQLKLTPAWGMKVVTQRKSVSWPMNNHINRELSTRSFHWYGCWKVYYIQ